MQKDDTVKKYQQKVFILMVKLLFIFGIPAVIAGIVGTYFDQVYMVGHRYVFVLLGCAFVGSWVVTILQLRILNRSLRAGMPNST